MKRRIASSHACMTTAHGTTRLMWMAGSEVAMPVSKVMTMGECMDVSRERPNVPWALMAIDIVPGLCSTFEESYSGRLGRL